MWSFFQSEYGKELDNVDLEVRVDDNHNYTITYRINGSVRARGQGRGMSNALEALAEEIEP